MKKCAKTFHIKTESLVELVKKQQDNLERDLARGIIPTGVQLVNFLLMYIKQIKFVY